MPARRSSILWLSGFNVDTHLLRRTTAPRSRRWGTAVLRGGRAERWRADELPLVDAMAGVDTEDAAGVCAPGDTDGAGAGDGATRGVVSAGTLAGGAVTVGGGAAGTVAAGAGVVAPGTETVTGETPGLVLAFPAAGTVAARPGNASTANSASNATVSSAPIKNGRRAASPMCLAAETCRSSGFPTLILNPMINPFRRTSCAAFALPLNTLV